MDSDSDSLFLCQPCSDDDGSILGIKVKVANHYDNILEMMISEWLQSLTGVILSDEYWLNDINDRILSSGDEDCSQQISIIAQRHVSKINQ